MHLESYYAVGRVERGSPEWWRRGKVWPSEPGSIKVKEPGDVHPDIEHNGPAMFTAYVGLYDRSQLARHFRRIVGVTPARYANTRPRPSVAI